MKTNLNGTAATDLYDEEDKEYFNNFLEMEGLYHQKIDALSKLDVSELNTLVKNIRLQNKNLKDFPNVVITTNADVIEAIRNKFEKELKNEIKYIYNIKRKDIETRTFEVTNKDAYIISKFYPSINHRIMYIFYKNEKYLEEIMRTSKERSYPLGNYTLSNINGYCLIPIEISEDAKPTLNDDMLSKIQKDIDLFFGKREFFTKNSLSYKRGILLYGPPGNGKTSSVREILRNNKDAYGIVIDATKDFYEDVSGFLKYVLNDKKKIIVFEDVDGINSYSRSAFLNFLDGLNSIDNMVVVATSNNIAKIDYALIQRPSRFDKIYYFGNPNEKVRRKLLTKFFPELTGKGLEDCVKATDKFSGAYFKELFIFKNLHDTTILKAIKAMKDQMNIFKTSEKNDDNYVG